MMMNMMKMKMMKMTTMMIHLFLIIYYGLLFPISSKVSFIYIYIYMHHPTDRITHTTAFVTQVMEHWLEREYKLKLCCGVVLSVINDIRSVARPCIHLNKGENGEIHRYIEADIVIERRGGKGDSYREERKDINV